MKENPKLVSSQIAKHKKKNSEEYYYKMRTRYNNLDYTLSKASLFIYLNKTSFNGIWRVNNKGQFNVPYGYKESPSIPDEKELISVSNSLLNAEFFHKGYIEAVETASKHDFIYFDPPYPPLNGTSYFTHYTKERFTEKDHQELADVALDLSKRGCYVMISNSDTKFIRSLYKNDFNIFELEVMRWIRADGKRYKVKEIAITNYDI